MKSLAAAVLTVSLVVVACSGDGTGASPTTAGPALLEHAAAFSESWGCAYGLWAGDPDQRTGLFLEFEPGPQPVPEVAQIGDGNWTGEVQVGRDLFANWCDDVIEANEPEPVVAATYAVVAGTIRASGGGEQCPSSVTAEISDLVVEADDGRRIVIPGSVEITNDAWGCFAG